MLGVKAIDYMNYVSTPEFGERWDKAKQEELICRIELGGFRKISTGKVLT